MYWDKISTGIIKILIILFILYNFLRWNLEQTLILTYILDRGNEERVIQCKTREWLNKCIIKLSVRRNMQDENAIISNLLLDQVTINDNMFHTAVEDKFGI